MYYPDEVIEEVRMKNDIVDVISGYVKLQKKGANYFGLCPFHNEKSPSFSVSPGKQMYYCFGCGAGGNVLTFVMEYENYTFQEALQSLADRAGVTLPKMEYSKEAREQAELRSRLLEVNKLAANYFYYQMKQPQGEMAYEYFHDKRKLTDETMLRFGLGYSNKTSDDLYRFLKDKGYDDAFLSQTGLVTIEERGGRDKFWNRVMFPIMDVNNRVIGFGGRVMGDGEPKYLNSPETRLFDKSRNLYGLNYARTTREKYMLVCEGYLDVISMHQAGFKNSVASLGTALTTQHASLLKRYTDEVILTYDSDGAGVKAALRAIPMLKAAGISTRVLHMDPYKDPDEFIKTLGAEAFQERIDQAENSFLFEISILERDFDMRDPEGKTGFYQAAARKLMEFEQELERENYIQAVAERYHISFDSLRKMVNREAMRGTAPRREREEVIRPQKKKEKEDGKKTSQRLLLTWLIEQKGLYEKISAYLAPEDFTDPLYREVAEKLFEQLKNGEVNPARILSAYEDAEQQREVAALFNATVPVETKAELEKALNETLLRVLRGSIEYRTAHLDPADMAGLQKIVADKRRVEAIGRLHISLD